MSTNLKIVAWWLACSVLAVLISMGFTVIGRNLPWYQQSRGSEPTKVVQVQLQWR